MISSTTLYGVVAQLVERYPEEVGVGGSSPSDSTFYKRVSHSGRLHLSSKQVLP